MLGNGQWSEEVVPTVAFNLRQVRKGNVTMKVWDVAVSFLSHGAFLDFVGELWSVLARDSVHSRTAARLV